MSKDRLVGSCDSSWESCSYGLSGWLDGNPYLSWTANSIIVAIVFVLLWYIFSYLRRPLCVDCEQAGRRKRTKYMYDNHSVCRSHWYERKMAAEQKHKCPKHSVLMQKIQEDSDVIDVCPHGCVFLDDGELNNIKSRARSSGQSSGQVIGIAIGSAIN
jgi:hypothetical protein